MCASLPCTVHDVPDDGSTQQGAPNIAPKTVVAPDACAQCVCVLHRLQKVAAVLFLHPLDAKRVVDRAHLQGTSRQKHSAGWRGGALMWQCTCAPIDHMHSIASVLPQPMLKTQPPHSPPGSTHRKAGRRRPAGHTAACPPRRRPRSPAPQPCTPAAGPGAAGTLHLPLGIGLHECACHNARVRLPQRVQARQQQACRRTTQQAHLALIHHALQLPPLGVNAHTLRLKVTALRLVQQPV